MKGKVLGGVVVAILVVASAVAVFFPRADSKTVVRADTAPFEYHLDGSGFDGKHYIGRRSSYESTYLNIRAMNNSDVGEYGDPRKASVVRPLFSQADMTQIATGYTNVRNGFIMIDTAKNEAVTIELRSPVQNKVTNSNTREGTWWNYNRQVDANNQYGIWGKENTFGQKIEANTFLADDNLLDWAFAYNNPDPNEVAARRNVLYSNSNSSLIGVFDKEGYYEFAFDCLVPSAGSNEPVIMHFGFYIVHAENYYTDPRTLNPNNYHQVETAQGSGIFEEVLKPESMRTYIPDLRRPDIQKARFSRDGRYFSNYKDGTPEIEYQETRYSVSIKAWDSKGLPLSVERPSDGDDTPGEVSPGSFNPAGEGNYVYGVGNVTTLWQFPRLGNYQITAEIVYWDPTANGGAGALIKGLYSSRTETLNVFGVEIYYENYEQTDENPQKNLAFGGEEVLVHYMMGGIDYEEWREINADISKHIMPGSGGNWPTYASASDAQLLVDVPLQITYLGVQNVQTAVTNAPPVVMSGNVKNNGKVFFNDGFGWTLWDNFHKDDTYEKPGEYFIVVDYKYEAFDPQETFYQVFHFIIVNTINPYIQTIKNNVVYKQYFNDYVNRGIQLQLLDPTVLFLTSSAINPDRSIGPYEFYPKVSILYYPFIGGATPEPVKIKPVDNGLGGVYYPINPDIFLDGIHVFRMQYGTRFQNVTDYTVIVDNEGVCDFTVKSSAKGHSLNESALFDGDAEPNGRVRNNQDFSIFGAGTVTLSWATKTSDNQEMREMFPTMASSIGVFAKADITYYPFVENPYYFNDAAPTRDQFAGDVNVPLHPDTVAGNAAFEAAYAAWVERDKIAYVSDPTAAELNSPHILGNTTGPKQHSVTKIDDRWYIIDNAMKEMTFSNGGLYFIRITDRAGNETDFGFLIDTTQAGFAQNPKGQLGVMDEANIVSTIPMDGVKIGMGKRKIVNTNLDMAETFGQFGIGENSNVGFNQKMTDVFSALAGNGGILGTHEGIDRIIIGINQGGNQTGHSISADNNNWDNLTGTFGGMYNTNYDPNNDDPDANNLALSPEISYNREMAARYDALTGTVSIFVEGFYFLRVTDELGNETGWYVWVNLDKSQGMVMETSGTMANITGLSEDISIVRPNGMSNLRNIYFSFVTNAGMWTGDTTKGFYGDESDLRNYQKNGNASGDAVAPAGEGDQGRLYVVDKVEVTFYPFAFHTNPAENANYPFSPDLNQWKIYEQPTATTSGGEVYKVGAQREPEKLVYPINTLIDGTEAGLYIISRHYDYTYHHASVDGSSSLTAHDRRDRIKNHFFIVDREVVIPLMGDPFESGVMLQFSPTKFATYRDMSFTVKTNTTFSLTLPKYRSKYGANTTLTGLTYPKWNPTFQDFNVLGETSDYGTSYDFEALRLYASYDFTAYNTNGTIAYQRSVADVAMEQYGGNDAYKDTWRSKTNMSEGGVYKMQIRDGSGGINWSPYVKSAVELSSNKSEISIRMDKGAVNAYWIVSTRNEDGTRSERRIPQSVNSTQFDIEAEDYLYFQYSNSGSGFFADIVDGSTEFYAGNTPIYRNQLTDDEVNIQGETYNYRLSRWIIAGDERLIARLYSQGLTPADNFDTTCYIFIDNAPPIANLTRVRTPQGGGDKLWQNAPEKKGTAKDNYMIKTWLGDYKAFGWVDEYVYAIDNDFAFRYKYSNSTQEGQQNNKPETHKISYQEVSSDMRVMGAPVPFSYGPNTGDAESFATIVKLQAGHTRYFKIIELDEAENIAIYYVRLRGADVTDRIGAIGINGGDNLIDRSGRAHVFGKNITLDDTYVFWNRYSNFEMSYTTDNSFAGGTFHKYLYLGQTRNDFNTFIRTMLAAGVETNINLVIRDGFGEYTIRISQISSGTPLPTLALSRPLMSNGIMSNDLRVTISNYKLLTERFKGLQFDFKVWKISAVTGWDKPNPDVANDTFNTERDYETLPGHANTSIVIGITDDFGREVITENHGSDGMRHEHYMYGTPRILQGVRYVGHENGVFFDWNSTTFRLKINGLNIEKATDNELKAYNIERVDVGGGRMNAWVRPRTNLPNGDTGTWQAIYEFKVTEVKAEVIDWKFYHVLPDLQFKTINGQSIEKLLAEDKAIEGLVEVSLERRGFLFGSNITYRVNGNVTSVNRFATRFILERVGTYEVTITNDVSAAKTYKLTISEVDNVSYKVKYNGKDLLASPVPFQYNIGDGVVINGVPVTSRNIDVYWISGSGQGFNTSDIVVDCLTSNPTYLKSNGGNLRVVPSLNNEAQLYRVRTEQTSNMTGTNQSGVWWEIYYLQHKKNGARVYFAIACTNVSVNEAFTPYILSTQSTSDDVTENFNVGDKGELYFYYRTMNNDGIELNLSKQGTTLAGNNPSATNVYYMDYYQNGVYGGRVYYGEPLRIQPQDYGVITVEVYDWAGNKRIFTSGANKLGYFTVYNFARPPLLINGQTAISEMTYQDSLDITCITNFEPLHGTTLGSNANYVSRMEVKRDGEVVDDVKFVPDSNTEYAFTLSYSETGRYEIYTEYVTTSNQSARGAVVSSTYVVYLVNQTQYMQSYSWSGASNIRLTKVTYGSGRIDVTRQFGSGPMSTFFLSHIHGSGYYDLTFSVDATNLRDAWTTKPVRVYVARLELDNATMVKSASVSWGGTKKGSNIIRFRPSTMIALANNNTADMKVYRDGKQVVHYSIGTRLFQNGKEIGGVDENGNEPEDPYSVYNEYEYKCGGAGNYQVVVTASNGTVVMSDGFTLEEADNETMGFVGIGFLVGGLVLVLLFARLRSGMRVK